MCSLLKPCRNLAERSIRSSKDDTERVATAFQAFTGRKPDTTEQATLLRLLADERSWFGDHKDEATRLLTHGESKASTDIDSTNLAAMTTVCQAILNLDATIWKR